MVFCDSVLCAAEGWGRLPGLPLARVCFHSRLSASMARAHQTELSRRFPGGGGRDSGMQVALFRGRMWMFLGETKTALSPNQWIPTPFRFV